MVTGMGVVAPNAIGCDNFKKALLDGVSGIEKIDDLVNRNIRCQIGGIPDESKLVGFSELDSYELKEAGGYVRYACHAALQAKKDAGLLTEEGNNSDVDYNAGIVCGSLIGAADTIVTQVAPLIDQGRSRQIRSYVVEHTMFSSPSAVLAGILGLGNRTITNSSACSSGTEAILLAYEHIARGGAERMFAGGSEGYSLYSWGAYDALRITNRKHNHEPTKASMPMSSDANGFVPSAGSAILHLEELGSAKQRGAKIYGEIIGGSSNCGGQRNGGSMTFSNPEGVRNCITAALKDAGISGSEIDYVSGHLTSTTADVSEIENWTVALGRSGKEFPLINSAKGMIGHCIGAAGAIEMVAGLIQMNHGFVHGNLNSETVHPGILSLIDKERIPLKTIHAKIEIMMKASFGFGDVNACLVVRKYQD